jgi:hypothetical protein
MPPSALCVRKTGFAKRKETEMPRNNSKERQQERRRKAVVRMLMHASNPHGCSRQFDKHTDEQHQLMLDEANRIKSKA